MTYVRAQVSRPTGRGQSIGVRFLVDTGAVYTVLPEDVWPALKLKPQRTVEFSLADGTIISRQVSECRFTIEGQSKGGGRVCGHHCYRNAGITWVANSFSVSKKSG